MASSATHGGTAGGELEITSLESTSFPAKTVSDSPTRDASPPECLDGYDPEACMFDSHRNGEVQPAYKGWAWLSAEQNNRHNGSFFRRFGDGHQRCITHLTGRIVNLLDQLQELDTTTAGAHLRTWSVGQRHNAGEEYEPDKIDLIMDELQVVFDHYDRLVLHDKTLQALPKPHSAEVSGLHEQLETVEIDKECLSYMLILDDFISTRPSQAHMPYLASLFYNRFGQSISKFFFGNNPEDVTKPWKMPTRVVQWINAIVMTLFAIVMILVPVGLLYLYNLTKTMSFVVVVLFISLCGTIIVVMRDNQARLSYILIGVSAYAAVLVTFLAQI